MQVHDDRGVLVCLDRPPARIVSLVPSTTETLHALGAPVVGVTRFCARPADRVAALPKVGGTKDVDPERVRALAPDLIVGNCEENTREIFDALAGIAPVYAAFPRDVDGALADLDRLGDLVGRPVAALRARIEAARARLRAACGPRARVAALVWRGPWMAAGRDTFIHAMLDEAGLDNHLADRDERYPEVTPADLRGADLVLLTSEPFPFRRRHADELTAAGVRRIRYVDGEHLTWHGVRMAEAFDALAHHLTHGWPDVP